MRKEIQELAEILATTEVLDTQDDIVQELKRLSSEWSYAESQFQVAFHNTLMWAADDPPVSGSIFDDLGEAFEAVQTCSSKWKTLLKKIGS